MNPLHAVLAMPEPDRMHFLQQLETLFAEIDEAYETAAAEYGFSCNGCDDNCCLTRFHHHTLLELAALETSFSTLPPSERQDAARRAKDVLSGYEAADRIGRTPRLMCPLNVTQRCRLYRSRPMICRMHGIPHVIRGPGRVPAFGAGCADFERRCKDRPGKVFDRTPLYRKMAALEQTFRTAAGCTEKMKLTVADMVLLFEGEAP